MSNRFPQRDSSSVSNLQPPSSGLQATPDIEDRCNFRFADGRRCTSLCAGKYYPYCASHALRDSLPDLDPARPARTSHLRERFQSLEEDVSSEFLGIADDFASAAAINRGLRRVVIQLAANRISTRRAAVLSYTFQLLLQTLSEPRREAALISDQHDGSEGLGRALDEPSAPHSSPVTRHSSLEASD